ncbi:MAG: hypothetical protein JSU94_09665 [Phycisphaerales bacterium]|nr:MAG: hypothetical protein JSU94_09665 [Phycisphaerales bacterium]
MTRHNAIIQIAAAFATAISLPPKKLSMFVAPRYPKARSAPPARTICTLKHEYILDIVGDLPTILLEIDSSTGSLKNKYITGQYLDSESREYFLRARQYNPHIARFTSRDPVTGSLREPLTLHKYLYCLAAPSGIIARDLRLS